MNQSRSRQSWVLFLLLVGSIVFAQEQGPPGKNGMVEWLTPPVPAHRPQTDAEQEMGRQKGRQLPPPELLQPQLDSGLPAYTPRTDVKLSGSFKAAASDILPGLVKSWISAFQHYYPNVKIDVPPPFAGSIGAQELVENKLDFVFVSRELRPDDVTGFKVKFGYLPLSVPICGGSYRHFGVLDAVPVFVNKENPIEQISFDQLDAVFSKTHHRGGEEVTKWGQLGLKGDWADAPIHIYGSKPWNGFEEFVRQRVLSTEGHRGEWRDDVRFAKLVFPISGSVSQDRYGIGYAGISYLDTDVRVLPIARDAKGPFYPPTYENVAAALYPLSRVVYLNTNRAPGKSLDPALGEFIRFILSKQGQQLVLDQAIFLPLRGSQAAASRTLIQ